MWKQCKVGTLSFVQRSPLMSVAFSSATWLNEKRKKNILSWVQLWAENKPQWKQKHHVGPGARCSLLYTRDVLFTDFWWIVLWFMCSRVSFPDEETLFKPPSRTRCTSNHSPRSGNENWRGQCEHSLSSGWLFKLSCDNRVRQRVKSHCGQSRAIKADPSNRQLILTERPCQHH